MSSFPHPPTKILTVYIKVLIGFSHIHIPDSLHPTLLSLLHTWSKFWKLGRQAECTFQEQGREGEPLIALVQLKDQLAVMSSDDFSQHSTLVTGSYNHMCSLLHNVPWAFCKGFRWNEGGSFGGYLAALKVDATATIMAHKRENTG